MIHIAFAFNFNIQRSAIEVGEEKPIIEQGYKPLLRLLLKYGVKADLFLSGFSTRLLQEMEPEVLEEIRKELGKSFELGTYTYTHPIPQLLEPLEMERQIRRGLQIDREFFKTEPAGFLPPEFAYTRDMVRVLAAEKLCWIVVLASFLKKTLPGLKEAELYFPLTAIAGDKKMTTVPASYQLPGLPPRFFKLYMKGQLQLADLMQGVRLFAEEHPDGLLLIKRDAETIFIDAFNSGFDGTERVFEEFLAGLSALVEARAARFVTIGEFLQIHPPCREAVLPDFLGNTSLETFTEGDAAPLWDLTRKVRELLFRAQEKRPGSKEVEEAWEHLLLSHNSDGRIGFWHSEWNPGEHIVAPTRRKFVEDHLRLALRILERRP